MDLFDPYRNCLTWFLVFMAAMLVSACVASAARGRKCEVVFAPLCEAIFYLATWGFVLYASSIPQGIVWMVRHG